MKRFALAVLALLIAAGATFAQEKRGTPAQAMSLVKKAIEYYKANGKEKAFAEFSNPKGQFVNGDLYIFVYDMKGVCVAHGADAKRIGKDQSGGKDADGKFFVKERIELAKTKGKGWQEYKFLNPESHKTEAKTAFVEKCDDYIFGAGAYKP